MNQKTNVIAMPIASGPTPFEQAITEVIAALADQAAADYHVWDGKYAAEQVAEAVATIVKAHHAEISLVRRRTVRGEVEAARALERSRAYELVADHVKATAAKLLEENARLFTHVSQLTARIQHVNDALGAAPIPEKGDRYIRVADVLAAMDKADRPYPWPAPAPFIAGIAVDDSHHIGWFVNLQQETITHLFVGWAAVLHSPLQSVVEPVFRVHGRPVPESQLSAAGWRLDTLR